jgi:hypothetical protein
MMAARAVLKNNGRDVLAEGDVAFGPWLINIFGFAARRAATAPEQRAEGDED